MFRKYRKLENISERCTCKDILIDVGDSFSFVIKRVTILNGRMNWHDATSWIASRIHNGYFTFFFLNNIVAIITRCEWISLRSDIWVAESWLGVIRLGEFDAKYLLLYVDDFIWTQLGCTFDKHEVSVFLSVYIFRYVSSYFPPHRDFRILRNFD